VQAALRIPRGLEGLASTVTAKFAIGKDGTPSRFHMLPPVPDARIADAIWQAVQGCRWLPGTHPNGAPMKLWVLMPFRFQPN
jgi:protein TonB